MTERELPLSYIEALKNIPTLEVSFGAGGLKLFNSSEIAKGQIGYSISKEGKSFVGSDAGDWQSNWIVIGYDTGLGDPLILDVADINLPIFTSMHGEGSWALLPVAVSMEAFRDCFQLFAAMAQNRSNPIELDKNPLSSEERETYLNDINAINKAQIESDFWEALLEY